MIANITDKLKQLLPGLLLCGAVTATAYAAEYLEAAFLGNAWLESLVLSILLGSLLRTTVRLPHNFEPGIRFGAKALLELAVLLLGVNVSAGAIMERGPALVAGIAGVVVLAIICSYLIGRALGLPSKMAALIACGNSICGTPRSRPWRR